MRSHHVRSQGIAILSASAALFLALTLVPSAQGQPTFANTWYVDVNVPAGGANTGLNWTDAFLDLQTALTEADNSPGNDEIWVAAGTYYPGGPGNRAATFNLRTRVSIYGGFLGTNYPVAGGETDLVQRCPEHNITVLSGDIDQNGVLDGNNSYHVVTSNMTDQAVLNGFTISGGFANGANDTSGAGINLSGLDFFIEPFIVRCTLSGNFAK